MGDYLQQQRKLRVTTPLGPDELLLVGFSGNEGISTLFGYRLEMIARTRRRSPSTPSWAEGDDPHAAPGRDELHAPERPLRPARTGEPGRDVHGLRGGDRPDVWKLTRKAQSRIFQHLTVPEILKKVFKGFTVDWQLNAKYEPGLLRPVPGERTSISGRG